MASTQPEHVRCLSPRRHTVYRLAPDLLLVFKPCGHTEPEHTHAWPQTLTVLAGELRVVAGGRTTVLFPGSPVYDIPTGTLHATTALQPTWLAVRQDKSRSEQ